MYKKSRSFSCAKANEQTKWEVTVDLALDRTNNWLKYIVSCGRGAADKI